MKYAECVRCGRISPRLSVLGNSSMAAFKFCIGMISGSKGLVADSIHSIADTISSIFVLIALALSDKPKDKGHPYGHGKAEYLSTIFASVFILLCAVLIFFDALHSLKTGISEPPQNAALAATIISLAFSWLMYSSNTCAGTQLNSPAMLADAAESKADSLTALAVLIGLIGTKMGFVYADTIAAFVVCAFVLRISIEMFMKGVNGLIDISVDRDTLQEIKNLCRKVGGVERVQGIRSRCMGQKCLVDIDIEVLGSKTMLETHDVVQRVRAAITGSVEGVDGVFVRTIPVEEWKLWGR
jgi:cation diffusion facilitator family transporter